MKDILFKFRCLFTPGLISNTHQHITAWKEFVWDVELDDLYCCSGRDCGCWAATNRQYIKWQWLRKKND